tara:strand:+ start:391 stop:738 length:348 start_codon:yes stop_codon:yes gene_type:complete
MTDDNKSRLLGGGVPVIGAPKLSDAPLLPDEVLAKFIPVFEEALAQGASYAQPVQIELLILATALRDLRDLRAAAAEIEKMVPNNATELTAIGSIRKLLPPKAGFTTLNTSKENP